MSALSSVLPIDAVIPWVDGSDPAHKAKLEAHFGKEGNRRPAGASEARFHDSGEIYFCVMSLLKFAPWLRTIFIVTDAQTPSICRSLANTPYYHKVRVVDHRVVFRDYEECLPTFNSLAISAMLWRVPELAENFLYLNDDFVLIQPTWPEDFFQDDQMVIRGRWQAFSERRISKTLVNLVRRQFNNPASVREIRFSFMQALELSARILGFTEQYYNLPHNPHPWKKSILEEFYRSHPELLRKCASYKLRSAAQFVTEGLMAHLAINQQKAVLDNRLRTLQLKPGEQSAFKTIAKLAAADADNRFVFACVQSLEMAPPKLQSRILEWLVGRIGGLESVGADRYEVDETRRRAA